MYVYRIEHPETGKGPYSTGWSPGISYASTKRHPAPDEDGLGYMDNKEEYCGFESLEKLCGWFNLRNRRAMAAQGFLLLKIRIVKGAVRKGKQQVLFIKRLQSQSVVIPWDRVNHPTGSTGSNGKGGA